MTFVLPGSHNIKMFCAQCQAQTAIVCPRVVDQASIWQLNTRPCVGSQTKSATHRDDTLARNSPCTMLASEAPSSQDLSHPRTYMMDEKELSSGLHARQKRTGQKHIHITECRSAPRWVAGRGRDSKRNDLRLSSSLTRDANHVSARPDLEHPHQTNKITKERRPHIQKRARTRECQRIQRESVARWTSGSLLIRGVATEEDAIRGWLTEARQNETCALIVR